MKHDVIIAGLGAMGSAAAYELTRRGARVLGFDKFRPPHDYGSSHGHTRIIREAYFEDPAYVPLVQRAYQLWSELQRLSSRQIFQQTGGVMIGAPDGVLVQGAVRSAREHKLSHQVLSADDLRRCFPAFAPAPEMVGVWEPRAGVLSPETVIQTHLELASARGAEMHFEEPIIRWEAGAGVAKVWTERGEYSAKRLILATGAWMPSIVPLLAPKLHVERQVLFWFAPTKSVFGPTECPISIWEYEPAKFFYGFPDAGLGVKVAFHHQGEASSPDAVRRTVDDAEISTMRAVLERFLPHANGSLLSLSTCLYTNTPDEHFIVDTHPDHPTIILASPCSGHGFKFSSVVGEILADLAEGKPSQFDLSLFRASRWR